MPAYTYTSSASAAIHVGATVKFVDSQPDSHEMDYDEVRFYKHMRMYSLEDGEKQMAIYQKNSNTYIKTCLGTRSTNTIVRMYQGVMF